MRAALYNGPRNVTVGERPDPVIAEPTDAVVRVVLGCVCGSDLWYYRGESPHDLGPIGHEFIGVVEESGAEVRGITRGSLVVAPFTFSDGTCPNCRAGVASQCVSGGGFDVFDFELTGEQIAAIDALDTGVRGGPEPDTITLENYGIEIPEA